MLNKLNNKQKVLVGLTSIVLIFAAYTNFVQSPSESSKGTGNSNALSSEVSRGPGAVNGIVDQNKKSQKDKVDRPESTKLYKSVESMASDIVSGSIDPEESLAYLIKKESHRILELNKKIAQAKRELAEANYKAAYENYKTKNVAQIVDNEINGKGDDSANSTRVAKGPYYNSNTQMMKQQKEIQNRAGLEKYSLVSTVKIDGQWFARLSDKASGESLTVIQGQQLSDVVVKNVTETKVTLSSGNRVKELIAY